MLTKKNQNRQILIQNILQLYIPRKSLDYIINNIKKTFNDFIYKEDKTRLFLKIDNYLIIIAKNNLGNLYNHHEYTCSQYFHEYTIETFSYNGYYCSHSNHIIIKPFISRFDYTSTSKNKELFYQYSSSFLNRGITKNFNPKIIGLYNSKIVLRSYLSILPYTYLIQCHKCGKYIYSYLEPFCPYCNNNNFNDNNFINNLFNQHKEVC